MKSLAAVALLLVASLTGCHEPHSFMVKRPENQVADKAVTQLWADDIKRVAQDGDWLLTRGYFATSDVISLLTSGEDVSHASIYDAKKGTVIEAVGAGVREVTLEELLHRNHHIIVVRPTNMTAAERAHAVTRARSRLGQEFDKGGMIGLGTNDKVYCSELVWWASQSELHDDVHERVITPTELMKYSTVVYWSGERTDAQILELAVEHERAKPHVATR
jgi:uncharacterized protein YycO